MVDEKTGTTGDPYDDGELYTLMAGAKAGLSAEQIAVRLRKRSPTSVQVKASELKLSLATYKPVTIAPSGQLGIRFGPEELPKYRAIVNRVAERDSRLDTLTKVIKAALRALDKQTP